ncbi:type II toxin-antitoxin system VapC family toxin [Falsiroseomonas sp.]|uniref:type II toxin-antitoxin system VapC family toxin n=1 Tax=Falsiroseomonas sp. TaxID=2870721 RepID=UPI003F72F4BF
MILDTSALFAILSQEPDAQSYADAMALAAGDCAISAATLVEATMVVEGRGGAELGRDLNDLLRSVNAAVVPVSANQAELARDGWRRFGKGRHPAKLNLGDCFSYALAQERGEPLLFKGDDFAQTDVKRAI